MKKLFLVLLALHFFTSTAQAQENEHYYFRVLYNSFVVNYDSGIGKYKNYIYSGNYIDKSKVKHSSLDRYLTDLDNITDHICLIFSNMIYIISYSEFTQEEDWKVVTKARITIINDPGTPQEKMVKQILTTGDIKFDPNINIILFIKVTAKNDESRKL